MILPLISVVIPTYNYAQYISQAIESILSQNYPGTLIQIIVVDDGSTDQTRDVLAPYIDQNVIEYYFQQNNGKAVATRTGIEKAHGAYIFNLDADDYFLPNKVLESVEAFEMDPEIVHVASPANIYYQQNDTCGIEMLPRKILGKVYDGKQLLDLFYRKNIFYGGGSTYSARASVLKKVSIPDDVDMYMDEFLVLSVLPYGKSYFVDHSLSVWRVHTKNYSGRNDVERQHQKEVKLLKASLSVLTYLKGNHYEEQFVKMYQLKHETRIMAYKEITRKKSVKDIFRYAYEVLNTVGFNFELLKSYNVINRLIPVHLFQLLKKMKVKEA